MEIPWRSRSERNPDDLDFHPRRNVPCRSTVPPPSFHEQPGRLLIKKEKKTREVVKQRGVCVPGERGGEGGVVGEGLFENQTVELSWKKKEACALRLRGVGSTRNNKMLPHLTCDGWDQGGSGGWPFVRSTFEDMGTSCAQRRSCLER